MLCFFYVLYLKTHNLLFIKSFKNFACQLNRIIKDMHWIWQKSLVFRFRMQFVVPVQQMVQLYICLKKRFRLSLSEFRFAMHIHITEFQLIATLITLLSWHAKFLKDLTKSRLWVFKYNTLKKFWILCRSWDEQKLHKIHFLSSLKRFRVR